MWLVHDSELVLTKIYESELLKVYTYVIVATYFLAWDLEG